ncbi:hypothetical protein ACLBWT_18460 [Paenibacillus sp. D51F]
MLNPLMQFLGHALQWVVDHADKLYYVAKTIFMVRIETKKRRNNEEEATAGKQMASKTTSSEA